MLSTDPAVLIGLLCLSIAGLMGVAAFFFIRAVYRYLTDPYDLKRFPAPSIVAAVTPLWCFKHSAVGNRFQALDDAHQKLGEMVRIGPDHVSINMLEAIKDIYGHGSMGRLMKADFYDTLAGEYHNIANTRDREEHQRKRKYISNAFALSNILELEPKIAGTLSLLLSKLDQMASTTESSRALDVHDWLSFFTFDVISQVAVGETFGFLQNGSDQFRGQTKYGKPGKWHVVPSTITSQRAAFRFKVALGQMSKAWYDFWTRILWFSRGKTDVDMFTAVAIGQVRERIRKDKDLEAFPPDFMSRLLKDKEGKPRNLPFMELVSEAIVLLNAGSDTTSSGLTSAIWELATHPAARKELQKELDGALGEVDEDNGFRVATYEQVKDLKYLQACLTETLRLNPPIPYGPPRLIIDPKGVMVAGEHFRYGTTVSVPTYSIMRHPDIFPDPNAFRPERWLEGDEIRKEMMQQAYIPFSTGPRACLAVTWPL
ncbi:hypothetical protein CLAIMM_04512 [Cladophialophora immunda]|nr:hypothetical protein CLAIMM_04512 [Cladophialophora immunda]